MDYLEYCGEVTISNEDGSFMFTGEMHVVRIDNIAHVKTRCYLPIFNEIREGDIARIFIDGDLFVGELRNLWGDLYHGGGGFLMIQQEEIVTRLKL